MKKHILLIDGNSIAHANHNANVLSVGDFQTQAIFGFLKSLRHLKNKWPRAEIIVLWDGKAQWRMDLYPEYKGNRAPLDEKQAAHKLAFNRQTPFIEKALSMLGIKQVRSPLLEADDLAGFFVRSLSATCQITLVSGDRDWISLVGDNVLWFDPIRDRDVSIDTLLDRTGYVSTDAYVQGKALQGDNSDNIPGIQGLGEKGAALFLAQHGDVFEYLAKVDAGTLKPASRKSKTAASLHPEQILTSPEGRALFERNMKLMDLRQSRNPEQGEMRIDKGTPNPAGFIALCERLAFFSILRDRRQFLAAFDLKAPEVEVAIPARSTGPTADEQLLHAGVDLMRPMRA